MNNTVIFQHKYLKYKNKYQILKNRIIQKGSGNPLFQCLVFGNTPDEDEVVGFYDIGIWANANYGKNFLDNKLQTWNQLMGASEFWDNLDTELTKMRKSKDKLKDEYFIAAIFDRSLVFWLNTLTMVQVCNILFKHISIDGIVCVEGIREIKQSYPSKFVYQNIIYEFHNSLINKGFHRIGTIGTNVQGKKDYYTLYSKNKHINIFLDDSTINKTLNNMIPYMIPYKLGNINQEFKYITETTQTQFIKNKIIDRNKFVCIPNSNGQYPTHIECENAKISK